MMGFFTKGKERRERAALEAWAMVQQQALAERAVALAQTGGLEITDDFSLRFEIMVLFTSRRLFLERQGGGEGAEERMQALWEAMFDGFDHSLRQRGVNDIRIGARMHKLLQHATGRRNAYLAAWEADDGGALRAAIGRNVLNGAPADDPRVARVLAALEESETAA